MHDAQNVKEPSECVAELQFVSMYDPDDKVTVVSTEKLESQSVIADAALYTDGPPDGGTKAWLVVIGGFVTYFTTFGLLNSFGVFEVYYKENLLSSRSSSQISWIGSTQVCLLFVGGIFFGPIFDRMGTKVLFVPGTLILAGSLICTGQCTRYWELMLSQGVLFGIGNAMLFYPTISTMSHWFKKRRGLALGIVVAGSSFGGIIWPIIIKCLLVRVSFGWTVRIVGLICLILLTPCCFIVIPRLPPQTKDDATKQDCKNIHRDTKYIFLTAGYVLIIWGMFIPFYFIPTFSVSHGMSVSTATYLVSILNAGSLVGRVVSGFCADKCGVFNTTTTCAILSGVTVLCMTKATSEPAIIALTLWYGFFSGGLISLQSACVAQITPTLQIIGLKIGILMSICSIGALTGAPLGGLFVSDDGQGYVAFSLFCGLMLLGGACLVWVSRLLQDRKICRKV